MTEKRALELQEGRLLRIAGPSLLPILEKRRKVAQERLLAKFREGSTDLLGEVACFEANVSLHEEVLRKIRITEGIEEIEYVR